MFLRSLACSCLLPLICGAAAAQSAAPRPAFEIADVHLSPHRTFPVQDGGGLRGDRYIIRQATMVNLIVAAYGGDPANVQGGPPWLETDRFDIIAKAPAGTSSESIKLMLQSLLADRFKLVTHNGDQQVAAYALTVAKDKPKMKESAVKAEPDCNAGNLPASADGVANLRFTCHNMTMDGLTTMLRQAAGGYLHNPVVDSTGLKGEYDFELIWTPRGQLAKAGADGISIFDAVEKQLGLKLTLKTAPQAAMIVDSVNETPTPNDPDLAKKLPPPPLPTFDVAVIKPNKLGGQDNNIDLSGSQLKLQNVSLRLVIAFAWDMNANDSDTLTGPEWLNSEKFDVLAKAGSDVQVGSDKDGAFSMDPEDLREMLRNLVTERFQIKAHMEDRPINAYTLQAVNPKLKKADPTSRTHCINGPGPGEKDPTTTNPALNRVIHCQNTTMAQFGDELKTLASGYIYGNVLDKTGLSSGWDFTLSFSGSGQLRAKDSGADNGASDPNGAISLMDAVSKELGLKLEKQRRPVPVLVIDSIQQKPTEN
jgi:uncharacterized protein (TIGR03435 family)